MQEVNFTSMSITLFCFSSGAKHTVINVHGTALHSEPFKCFSDVNKDKHTNLNDNDISQATFLPISSFYQLVSYNEVASPVL